MPSMYGTLTAADSYFATRLHTDAWDNATVSDRSKSLYSATRIIDRLNYKGYKSTTYAVVSAYTWPDEPTQEELRAAEASQELEFPRDADTVVPDDIKVACYEIALALLDGVDPDTELENLGVLSQGYSGIRTTFNRDQQPIEHLLHGIPSATAWRILRPFLRDGRAIKLSRVY